MQGYEIQMRSSDEGIEVRFGWLVPDGTLGQLAAKNTGLTPRFYQERVEEGPKGMKFRFMIGFFQILITEKALLFSADDIGPATGTLRKISFHIFNVADGTTKEASRPVSAAR